MNKDNEDEATVDVKYVIQNEYEDEGETSYDDTNYVQETDEANIEDDAQEEIEVGTESELPVFKKIRLQKVKLKIVRVD